MLLASKSPKFTLPAGWNRCVRSAIPQASIARKPPPKRRVSGLQMFIRVSLAPDTAPPLPQRSGFVQTMAIVYSFTEQCRDLLGRADPPSVGVHLGCDHKPPVGRLVSNRGNRFQAFQQGVCLVKLAKP